MVREHEPRRGRRAAGAMEGGEARSAKIGRAARIQLLVLDVDGVLTDGGLYYGASGEETKRFHVQDGLAVTAAGRAGLAVAVVSGRDSAAVTRRMSELGVKEVHQGL